MNRCSDCLVHVVQFAFYSLTFLSIIKLILHFSSLIVLIALSLGSVLSRFSPPNTPPRFQDSKLLPASPPSLPRPLSLSVLAGEGRSVFGEFEERVRGTRGWLWRWKCFLPEAGGLSMGSGGELEEPWWDCRDRSPRSSSWALNRAAVSSSLSWHSLLTVSWSNATWRVLREK